SRRRGRRTWIGVQDGGRAAGGEPDRGRGRSWIAVQDRRGGSGSPAVRHRPARVMARGKGGAVAVAATGSAGVYRRARRTEGRRGQRQIPGSRQFEEGPGGRPR